MCCSVCCGASSTTLHMEVAVVRPCGLLALALNRKGSASAAAGTSTALCRVATLIKLVLTCVLCQLLGISLHGGSFMWCSVDEDMPTGSREPGCWRGLVATCKKPSLLWWRTLVLLSVIGSPECPTVPTHQYLDCEVASSFLAVSFKTSCIQLCQSAMLSIVVLVRCAAVVLPLVVSMGCCNPCRLFCFE
jgi:hypothetical protein